MKKRIISLLLAIVMILGMCPMTFAEEAVVEDVVCEHAATTETITSNDDGTHRCKYLRRVR